MKNMVKHWIWLLGVLFVLGANSTGYSQCMLGATYHELKENYSSQTNLVTWKEQTANDGSPLVTYIDKDMDVMCCNYLEDGIVLQFRMIGIPGKWVNIWVRYAEENFVHQEGNKWMDFARGELWTLRVEDDVASISVVKSKRE